MPGMQSSGMEIRKGKDGGKMKKIAVRNLRLCTKDCLCLYVCPVGATDTENSIIDVNKCIGCGDCADACPSKAISMIPVTYPPQQQKTEKVCAALFNMVKQKIEERQAALAVAAQTDKAGLKALMHAFAKSEQLVAEDLMREAGFMLPQSANAHKLLRALADDPPEGFPVKTALELLKLLPCNEPEEN